MKTPLKVAFFMAIASIVGLMGIAIVIAGLFYCGIVMGHSNSAGTNDWFTAISVMFIGILIWFVRKIHGYFPVKEVLQVCDIMRISVFRIAESHMIF